MRPQKLRKGSEPMRILFMGTPDFAVASLRRLVITCILMNSSRDIMAIGRS